MGFRQLVRSLLLLILHLDREPLQILSYVEPPCLDKFHQLLQIFNVILGRHLNEQVLVIQLSKVCIFVLADVEQAHHVFLMVAQGFKVSTLLNRLD